jgi:nicotinamidase-related amidase
MRPALFVQDIQNGWLYDPDSNQDLRKSVEKRLDLINEAIAWFRAKGYPVIVGYTDEPEYDITPGSKSFEVPETVRIMATDHKVTKKRANAFADPELGAILKREGCDAFVIVGLSASGCVLATYFSAFDFDVKPYVLKGGIASHNDEHIRFAEDICDTVDLAELAKVFR